MTLLILKIWGENNRMNKNGKIRKNDIIKVLRRVYAITFSQKSRLKYSTVLKYLAIYFLRNLCTIQISQKLIIITCCENLES